MSEHTPRKKGDHDKEHDALGSKELGKSAHEWKRHALD